MTNLIELKVVILVEFLNYIVVSEILKIIYCGKSVQIKVIVYYVNIKEY